MRLGYNTNGLAHHRLLDAIDLLADEDYPSVAITLDARVAGPLPGCAIVVWPGQGSSCSALDRRGLACADRDRWSSCSIPQSQHDPTQTVLYSARRAICQDFL